MFTWRTIKKLIEFAINPKTRIWADVKVDKVLQFVDEFLLPVRCVGLSKIGNDRSFVCDFIIKKRNELENWNIHLNNVVSVDKTSGDEQVFSTEIFNNEKLFLGIEREVLMSGKFYKISNNRKVGSGDDAKAGFITRDYENMSSEIEAVMNPDIKGHNNFKPTLIIYFMQSQELKTKISSYPEHLNSGVVSFVMHFPDNRASLCQCSNYLSNE